MRRDDWGTPPWLFALLDEEFHFVLDAAAGEGNAKLPDFLTDAVHQPWPGEGAVFINPPYRRDVLEPILWRVIEQSFNRTIVALLPVRSEMLWWHEQVIPFARELRFVRGRVAFVPPVDHSLSEKGNRPVFASVVAIFAPGPRGRVTRLSTIPAPRNGSARGADARPKSSAMSTERCSIGSEGRPGAREGRPSEAASQG